MFALELRIHVFHLFLLFPLVTHFLRDLLLVLLMEGCSAFFFSTASCAACFASAAFAAALIAPAAAAALAFSPATFFFCFPSSSFALLVTAFSSALVNGN